MQDHPPGLQPLRAEHGPALRDFEVANRAYFAGFVADRGGDFYDRFLHRHGDLLAVQESGVSAYYVLLDSGGSVLGRFNLYDLGATTARLGYRVAERVAGHGTATATVRDRCSLAASRHGLRVLTAAVSRNNPASQRVLVKAGFAPVGPAGPSDVGGKEGTLYRRNLLAERPARWS